MPIARLIFIHSAYQMLDSPVLSLEINDTAASSRIAVIILEDLT